MIYVYETVCVRRVGKVRRLLDISGYIWDLFKIILYLF